MSSNPWGKEQPPRNPRCGYPEYDQLKVKGSQEIIGEEIEDKIEAIETVGFNPVMSQSTADQGLQQEKKGNDEEVFACPPLTGRECPRTRWWWQQFEIVFVTFPP